MNRWRSILFIKTSKISFDFEALNLKDYWLFPKGWKHAFDKMIILTLWIVVLEIPKRAQIQWENNGDDDKLVLSLRVDRSLDLFEGLPLRLGHHSNDKHYAYRINCSIQNKSACKMGGKTNRKSSSQSAGWPEVARNGTFPTYLS